MYEWALSAFAFNFLVEFIFGNALLNVFFSVFCFFPWEIIKSSTCSPGLRVFMVSYGIYPIVWQAWKGVFGCVYINEAKIGTINWKRYEVNVPFLFFSTFASHWFSDFCVYGNMETLVHLPFAVTENKYDLSFLI